MDYLIYMALNLTKRTRTLKVLTLCLLIPLINACAVMSKRDCLEANWYQQGFAVGEDGELAKSKAFDKRVKACAKFDALADQAEFERGYADGVLEYCRIKNAVKLGTRGSSTALAVCPEQDNPGFASAYQAGFTLNRLRQAENQARLELERLENREQYTRQRIGEINRSINNDSSDAQKQEARRRIRHLNRDVGSLRYNREALRQRYYKAKEAAETYAELLELEYDAF